MLAWYSGMRARMKRSMSAIRVATFVFASRNRMTSGSLPVRLRRPGFQYGFGSDGCQKFALRVRPVIRIAGL